MARDRAKVARLLADVGAAPATHAGLAGVRLDYVQAVPDGQGGSLSMRAALFLAAGPDGLPVGVSAIAGPGRSIDAAIDTAASRPPLPKTTATVLRAFVTGKLADRPFGSMKDPEERLASALFAETLRRLAEAVSASALPDHLREALDILGRWPTSPQRDLVDRLVSPGADGAAVRAYCMEAPFLAAAQWSRHREDSGAGFGRGGEPPLHPLVRKRLARLDTRLLDVTPGEASHAALIALASDSPVDWFPREDDPEGLRAMHDAARLCALFTEARIAPGMLVRSARGDWRSFVDRCLAAMGRHLPEHGSATDMSQAIPILSGTLMDPPQALARGVLLPLAARAGLAEDLDQALSDLIPLAAGILYRDKSLPACIEASGRWHAHLHELTSAMPSDWDDRSWPGPHPTVADGSLLIVPLLTGRDLIEEGSPHPDRNGVPGLDHCVGGIGYRSDAAAGRSHFVSVRRALPEGGYERLATGETRFGDGGLTLTQLLGRRNADPDAEVEAAMGRWLALPATPLAEREGFPDGRLREFAGYDPFADGQVERAISAWRPYLPRGWRDLDPEALAEAAGICAPAAAPRP